MDDYAAGGQGDGRLHAPSAMRNSHAIVEAFQPLLIGLDGLMLEIGSGTGQHSVALAEAYPRLVWQPSDAFDDHIDSIAAWVAHAGAANLRPPIWLDAAESWPDMGRLTGVFSANVIHIAPWAVAEGIFRGAEQAHAGLVSFYGPFREMGKHVSDSNAHFDRLLRSEDPAWGVRDIEDLADLAARAGYGPPDLTVMPSNNRLVTFQRG